jgi:hypothetical protein
MTSDFTALLQALPNPARFEVTEVREGLWLAAPGEGGLGQPGWWIGPPAAPRHRLFLPRLAAVLEGLGDRAGAAQALGQWISCTLAGQVAPAWRLPSAQTIHAWLAGGPRSVTAGNQIRRLEVVAEGEAAPRLCCVIREDMPALDPPRRAWLDLLLAEAVQEHRVVRLDQVQAGNGSSLLAETDLRGLPDECAEELARYALAALADCARSLLEPVELLCRQDEPGIQILGQPPQKERSKP